MATRGLFFLIPFLTVIAGIITYFIAADKPHSLVKDDYFKKGLAINQSIEKQQQAKTLNLTAALSFDVETQLINLTMSSSQALPEKIKATFSHLTQADKDQNITFERLTQNNYVAQLPQLVNKKWYILLSDENESWILKSSWHIGDEKIINIKAN